MNFIRQTQRGVVVIPKSVTLARIEDNFNIFDFTLTDDDIAVIESFECNGRIVSYFVKMQYQIRSSIKYIIKRAVVVAQLAERLLPIPEVRGSNPANIEYLLKYPNLQN